MTTWAALLSDIRTDLKDTGTTKKYTDGLLYLYAKDGIRDYSTWFPQRLDRVAISAVDSKYALPSNFVEDIYVECPLDTYLEKRSNRSGVRFPTQSRNLQYHIQGNYIYTNNPGDDIYLTYFAIHEVPASETDTTCVMTVPDADIELIRLFVKAKVYEYVRGRQASLDRFKLKGTRDDNPLEPEVGNLMEEYYRKIADRQRGGAVMLYRTGRMR